MVKKRFSQKHGLSTKTFSERVLDIVLAIPVGKVMTYGDVARVAGGGAMAAQSITSILGKTHDRGVKHISFHRIVYADGRVWIDDRHRGERMKKYLTEGIVLDERNRIRDFQEKLIQTSRSQEASSKRGAGRVK